MRRFILLLFSLATTLTFPRPSSAAASSLSDDDLRNIPSARADFDIVNGKLLAPILIPRVPGTQGSTKVQAHFVSFFAQELPSWNLTWENSTSKTPVTGDRDVPFVNLIFSRDPPWSRHGDVSRLTLVAHYDSKYEPAGFIGAIDSAAPCAMLMHVARSIDQALTTKWEHMQQQGLADGLEAEEGIQIVFLDGEEAFRDWTDTDSLYGARSLATQWEDTSYDSTATYRNPLDSISLFVLLDLLGSADSPVPSYFLTTHWAYSNMAELESRMRHLGLLSSTPRKHFLPDKNRDQLGFGHGTISDDHVPFMRRGVDVLHLIPTPFPPVWHKMEDDGEHLDLPTVDDWAILMTAFAVEWMDVKDFMPKRSSRSNRAARDSQGGKTEL